MLRAHVTQIEPALEARFSLTTDTASTKQFSLQIPSYPVVIEDGRKIHIYGSIVAIGRFYPFKFKGNEYLLHRPKEGTLDLYEVKN